jgi:hypothetical protein
MTRRWAISWHYKGQIAYFFEAGHSHQPQANRMMLDLFSNPFLCEIFHHAGSRLCKEARVSGRAMRRHSRVAMVEIHKIER